MNIQNKQLLFLIILPILIVFIIGGLYTLNTCMAIQKSEKFGDTALPNKDIQIEPPNEPKNRLVLYYTKWCGYSQQFLPEWNKFKNMINADKNKFPTLNIEEMVCEGGNEKICYDIGVKGYPTVILHKNGQDISFEYDRSAEQLVKFISENL